MSRCLDGGQRLRSLGIFRTTPMNHESQYHWKRCFAIEWIGILVFQDVVQNPELQSRKDFHGEKPSLPGTPPITAHTAKVLQQVDGAEIQEGGWVGGDAWFGSMMSVIETYKWKKVHSTFIIKNNQTFFPMQPSCCAEGKVWEPPCWSLGCLSSHNI
jgi:hypothetical protein